MFTRILVARRSEAASRVARTCRRLGITALGVYTEETVHTEACDQSFRIVELEGRVEVGALVAAAKEAEADAVYPGYGDGRDDDGLARALEAEGVPFVGLDPDAMLVVRDRRSFREAALRAGARVVPGSEGALTDADDARGAAYVLEYPICFKAQEADAGVGVEIARDEDELDEAFAKLRARAGERPIVLEQWFDYARVIQVLVAADAHGDVAAIAERECTLIHGGTVQIEESPSPALTFHVAGDAIREMLFDTAIRVASELNTVGLMSIEMLHLPGGRLFVNGARLGLPSTHAVCEMVTGLDLVDLQLQLAVGEPLPESVLALQPRGHAVSARIVATDAAQAASIAAELRFPAAPHRSVRIDRVATEGRSIPSDDRPVLSRVTSFAPIRHQAVLTLDRVLAGSRLQPYATNVALLRSILNDEGFRAGQYDRAFVGRLLAPPS